MRFFIVACLFGLLIGSVGCMTHNWSSPLPLFERGQSGGSAADQASTEVSNSRTERVAPGISRRAGIDPRAREIEGRLGL